MSKLIIPKGYTPEIDYMESQRAIKKIKDFFQQELAYGLKLQRVQIDLGPAAGLCRFKRHFGASFRRAGDRPQRQP